MTTAMTSQPDTRSRPRGDGAARAVEASDLWLSFGATQALRGASLSVAPGEFVALMGPSGCGKSTLLHCLAGILVPERGRVTVDGIRLDRASEQERSGLRLRRMGFVFQFGDLVPELTLAENVALPLRLTGLGRRIADKRARVVLERLDIADVADRRAGAVSGGEQQRAAVARAVAHEPAVLFADEPTGALDTVTGERVLDAMVVLARETGTTLILVTHDHRVAAHADRLITMRDGRVSDAGRAESATER